MSGHHHDDHHSTEQKPVSFTVPFILACVTLVILVGFLSLCNPKKGHHGECEGECTEQCAKECKEEGGHEKMESGKGEEAEKSAEATEAEAPAADTTAKAAEPKAEEKH